VINIFLTGFSAVSERSLTGRLWRLWRLGYRIQAPTERDGLWQVLDVLKLRIVSFVGQSEPMAASDSVDRRGPLVDGEHLAHHLRIGRGLLANERLSNQNLAVFKIDVFQL
jgi:hypothetical protein